MTSATSQIAAVASGLALIATTFIVFPRSGLKGLAKGVAVTVSLAVVAAILMVS